ncbi:hypothetical protein [Porphyromonas gingivalis]|uniref:hypothetical protein n=1 Tax=Porphyromonas gingivalis TaxID=837 RepID=UPI0005C6A8DF|nr:hypothetical protein [Porphyromonas gingivalis]
MESNSNIDEFISIIKDIQLLYQSAVYQELIKDLSTDLNSLLTKKLEYILNNNPTSPFFDNFNKSLLKGIERSREASEGMNNESYIETEVNEILSAQERILTEEDHKATIRKLRSERRATSRRATSRSTIHTLKMDEQSENSLIRKN